MVFHEDPLGLTDDLPGIDGLLQLPGLLRLGTLDGGRTPAELDATRFNRHTFWCGQSGSGKTYALGVVLEPLLLHTRLPILVLDPNADFVRLGDLRKPLRGSKSNGAWWVG
ncbi:helicase HerA domain-containing protein [Arthrobacter sp. L77]|uniref:helicase HerA domain-containing protein n=1 Tax=Arthrobacter sp. L77 TaxID=1496689 RepID=UPI001E5908C4|nr:DUF87 domain-containing protein [Arthrobacter sp. L77]